MSESIGKEISVSDACVQIFHKPHHCSRFFGHLELVRLDEDCQIVQIDNDLVVLPLDLDLSQYFGQSIGIMGEDHRILIRRPGA